MEQRRNLGFTLVEISITLIIIGILLGGIIAGQNLIHAGKLRQITADYRYYSAAIVQFVDKYSEMPGDMPNATDYWGSIDNSDECLIPDIDESISGNDMGVGTGKATCNGNGDGKVSAISSDQSNLMRFEQFRAWEHMANAEFINGQYTGVQGGGGSNEWEYIPEKNCPEGSFANSCWGLSWLDDHTDDSTDDYESFNREYGHILAYGTAIPQAPARNGVLTPAEAWQIDNKLDDGSPALGSITAALNTGTSVNDCTTADGDSTDLDADYNTDSEDVVCALYFQLPAQVRWQH